MSTWAQSPLLHPHQVPRKHLIRRVRLHPSLGPRAACDLMRCCRRFLDGASSTKESQLQAATLLARQHARLALCIRPAMCCLSHGMMYYPLLKPLQHS